MKTYTINKNGPVVLVSRPVAYTFPNSYAYLAGYLVQQHENVKVLFRQPDKQKLISEIMNLNPILVGFGNLYPELKEIGEIISLLKDAGANFPIVIGGQMVTPTPEFSVSITGADFGVIGEGEIILYNLTQALRTDKDPLSVKGLVINTGKEIISTGEGEYINNLADLPPIPYEFFPESTWLKIGRWYTRYCPQPHWRYNDKVINIMGGRGCPHKCNFCYHHNAARYRPISLMMEDAQKALDRFDGNFLYFADDLTIPNARRAQELVEGVKNLSRKIEFSLSIRFDVLSKIDDDLLKEIKKAGCRIMGLGVESGSDRILTIIGKRTNAKEMLFQLERLKNIGILPTVSIMVGQITETKEDVEASIEFVKKSVAFNPNIQWAFTITTPFPGSTLYKHIFEKGYLKNDLEFYTKFFSSSDESWNQIVNLSELTDEEVSEAYNRIMEVYINARDKSLGKIRGKLARKIEHYQIKMYRSILYYYTESKKPIVFKIVNGLFDGIQTMLEKLKLYTLKI